MKIQSKAVTWSLAYSKLNNSKIQGNWYGYRGKTLSKYRCNWDLSKSPKLKPCLSPSKNLNLGNWSTSKFNQITLTTLIIEKFTWSCQSFKKFSWILLNNNTDFTKSILLHPTTWLNSISYSKMLYYLQKLLILDLSIFRFSTKIMLSFCGDFLKFLPPQAWNKLGLESCGLHVLIPCKFTF